MVIISANYLGDLRTTATHLKSGNTVVTDAPLDNKGKGEAFSPTDLVCSALGSCMMTIMGQVAQREGIELTGLQSEIVKVMTPSPRKISEIRITFTHPHLAATPEQKEQLMHGARTCPVALSLSESIRQTVTFNW